MVNGNGMDSDGSHIVGDNDVAWNTNNGVAASDTWVAFEFTSLTQVGCIHIWNYNRGPYTGWERGLASLTVEKDAGAGYVAVGNVSLQRPPESGNYGELFCADSGFQSPWGQTETNTAAWLPFAASRVRFTDLVNFGVTPWGNSYGLSEVRFFSGPNVLVSPPPPSAPPVALPRVSISMSSTNEVAKEGCINDVIESDYGCHSSNSGGSDEWLSIDMGQQHTVNYVTVYNRVSYNCGSRLGNFEVWIGDSAGSLTTMCGTGNGCTDPTHSSCGGSGCDADSTFCCVEGPITVNCPDSSLGRYVTVLLPGNNRLLHLREVYLYGQGP